MFNILKKIVIHIRSSLKVFFIIAIALAFIIAAVILLYKPIYSVTFNGEFVGYSEDKTKLQARINEYIKTGDGKENVAFVQITTLPEYRLCLLKKDNVPNDDEIFEKVKQTGTVYYNYYAILEGEEEKVYVSTFSEAEEVVNKLKEKDSNNKDKISIVEKYSTELKQLTDTEKAIASLYVEKPKIVKRTYTSIGSTGYTAGNATPANLGISLIKPVSGNITSRFGGRASGQHTGLDIAAPKGTAIKAAASGTVTFSGGNPNRSYGYYLIISHGNGVQTLYGHCSQLLVSAGTKVSQGQVIAKVGSTGNSSGNHLHLEIRVNGTAINPQRYLY